MGQSQSLRSLRAIWIVLLLPVLLGCGGSGAKVPSLSDVPLYPGAAPGQTMAGFSPGGEVGGNIAQYTTHDSYDDVLQFYSDALATKNPQVLSHTSELGRQTALTMPQEKGSIVVAIQEFTAERSVNITFMAMGQM